MSQFDYLGVQILTRLGNRNVRKFGKHQGRHWTPPIGADCGGQTEEQDHLVAGAPPQEFTDPGESVVAAYGPVDQRAEGQPLVVVARYAER
ncbi:MAG: hypothetical protein ACP5P1_13240 [Acidimicrobiales bacterium]